MFQRGLFLILILGLSPVASPQNAPDPAALSKVTDEKKRAEAEKANLDKQRASTEAELKRLREGLIDAAAKAQSYERASRDVSNRLQALNREVSQISEKISESRDSMAGLLTVLQRLERNPPPAIAVIPQDAVRAAQAARLMSSITNRLAIQSDTLTTDLKKLEALQIEISSEQRKLVDSEKDLSIRREQISNSVKQKRKLEASIAKRSAEQETRIAKLTNEAKDLKALIAAFEKRARTAAPRVKPPKPGSALRGQNGSIPTPILKPRADRPPEPYIPAPDTARFADARGALRAPVQGKITRKYRSKNADGSRETGYTVATRPRAQVIAPYTGRIAFAGPFKTHGNVLMLDVGDNYFIVLTGLSKTNNAEGQSVSAGEPIGEMGPSGAERLYIEFWKNGTPIDPEPWLGTAFARAG